MRFLPPSASSDTTAVQRIVDLVNEVYAESEKGLWLDDAARTSPAEIAELIRAGEIAVTEHDGRIVGSVRVQRLDEATGEFGMLAADPAHRGTGIGRDLVTFAERTCRERGVTRMQLELLVPRTWNHPSKDFLAAWYTRLGYELTSTGTLDEAFPALAPLLATPCDFRIYHKAWSA
ncbi:MAG: GNAT family N-acetyltransferase [Umezawaea sp.]